MAQRKRFLADRKGKTARSAAKKQPDRHSDGRLSKRLNRLFWQTVLSVVLFLVVFAGGGLLPGQSGDLYSAVHQMITRQDALLESVQTLGQAISTGEDWTRAVRDWCQETFLPTGVPARQTDADDLLTQGTTYHAYLLPNDSNLDER